MGIQKLELLRPRHRAAFPVLPVEFLLNAAKGAASGALTDVGINDYFMKDLAPTLILQRLG